MTKRFRSSLRNSHMLARRHGRRGLNIETTCGLLAASPNKSVSRPLSTLPVPVNCGPRFHMALSNGRDCRAMQAHRREQKPMSCSALFDSVRAR